MLFWKELHEQYNFVKDQSNEEDPSPFGDLDATFLITNPNGIFYVSSNMSVSKFEKYFAIGAGSISASERCMRCTISTSPLKKLPEKRSNRRLPSIFIAAARLTCFTLVRHNDYQGCRLLWRSKLNFGTPNNLIKQCNILVVAAEEHDMAKKDRIIREELRQWLDESLISQKIA